MTLLLHMMTSSPKMAVQILRSNPCWIENKWNAHKISYKQDMHLKLSPNVIYKMSNTLQKKKIIFYKIFIVFLLFSIVLKQWNNRALIKEKQTFIRHHLIF